MGKVEGKAQWSRGVFISYSGFTTDGLEAFARGKATRIVCMDGFDLHCILSHGLDLAEVIALKVRRAGETNDAFASVRNLFPSQVF
jgi:restriction endonuclease Mrr